MKAYKLIAGLMTANSENWLNGFQFHPHDLICLNNMNLKNIFKAVRGWWRLSGSQIIGTIAQNLCKDKNPYDKNMYAHIMVFRNAWHRMILEICYEIVLQTNIEKENPLNM